MPIFSATLSCASRGILTFLLTLCTIKCAAPALSGFAKLPTLDSKFDSHASASQVAESIGMWNHSRGSCSGEGPPVLLKANKSFLGTLCRPSVETAFSCPEKWHHYQDLTLKWMDVSASVSKTLYVICRTSKVVQEVKNKRQSKAMIKAKPSQAKPII